MMQALETIRKIEQDKRERHIDPVLATLTELCQAGLDYAAVVRDTAVLASQGVIKIGDTINDVYYKCMQL